MKGKTLLAGAALIFLSSFLIFYKFNQVPKNLSFDEVSFAHLALSLKEAPFTPYSPLATGHSTLYFYFILLSFKIFGLTNFALRFPSAFFGLVGVVLFYFVLRYIFEKPLAVLLAFFFATLRWYFNFARFSFEATFLLSLELASVLFLLLFLDKKKVFYLVLSGLFAGLAFNSYTPGRIFFLLPLFFLIVGKFDFKRLHLLANYKLLVVFLAPFLITAAPLSLYLLSHQEARVSQQQFLTKEQLSIKDKAEFLLSNIKKTALMFNFKGDLNGRHNYPGKPALNPILGALFLFGLAVSIFQIGNFYNRFFIFYFLLSLIPTLLTPPAENPHMLRTFTVIPSLVYFIGQFLQFLIVKIRPQYKKAFIFATSLILILSAAYEVRTYFKYQSVVFKDAFEVKEKLEEIEDIRKVLPEELL